MSARTPSRERTLGRAILSDPLLAEVLESFADSDGRSVPNAADVALHRLFLSWGWLAWGPTGYVPGPHLLAYRRAQDPDAAELAPVVPLVRPARAGGRP